MFSPLHDATSNGDCPSLSHKLISAPELSKHLTTSHSPCLLSSGADINLCDKGGQSPLFIASEGGACDVKYLTTSHCPQYDAANNGDCPFLSHKLISAPELSKHLTTSQCSSPDTLKNEDSPLSLKAQYKSISKGTKDDEFLADSTTLLNLCGYPEEEISHQTEKQEEEKEAINVPKVQEEKEETILTREHLPVSLISKSVVFSKICLTISKWPFTTAIDSGDVNEESLSSISTVASFSFRIMYK
jgi:hypothetical protein